MTTLFEALKPNFRDPRPLVSWPERVGIFWSAKSGCTAVLRWYLERIGLRNAAENHSVWPHDYREQVLYRSADYEHWQRECDIDETRWLRVIRDPFKRAVSSFRHAVQFGYLDLQMSDYFGHRIHHVTTGISFVEFLAFLQEKGPFSDIHNLPQRHFLEERVRELYVVNIDRVSLAEGLSSFEKRAAIRHVPLDAERIVTPLGFDHKAPLYVTEENFYRTKMKKGDTISRWPQHEAFLSEEACALIRGIYAADFNAYGQYI